MEKTQEKTYTKEISKEVLEIFLHSLHKKHRQIPYEVTKTDKKIEIHINLN